MLYIVYIAIDASKADDWEDWMRTHHVPDVIATGHFFDATLARDEANDTEGRRAYRAVYRARSPEALDAYQADDAGRLQADHTERYEGHFDAHREILPVVTVVEDARE